MPQSWRRGQISTSSPSLQAPHALHATTKVFPCSLAAQERDKQQAERERAEAEQAVEAESDEVSSHVELGQVVRLAQLRQSREERMAAVDELVEQARRPPPDHHQMAA